MAYCLRWRQTTSHGVPRVQVEGVLFFDDEHGALARWDLAITGACEAVNKIVETITADPTPA
jgi:hypothetical protein